MAEGEFQTVTKAIAQWLETHGVLNWEAGSGGDTFTDRILPSVPDEAVGLRITGGFESTVNDNDIYPTMQVIGRSKSAQTAEERLWKVYRRLHGARYVTLPGDIFLVYAIGIQSGPVYVELDAGGRYVYSTNYRLGVRAATVAAGG